MNDFSQGKETRLLELLDQEIELFTRIYELTEKQAALLTEDDVGAFNSSLDSRQELIEKINGLHQESDSLMRSYASFTGSATGKKIDQIESAVAKRQELMAGCLALNGKNTAVAKEKAGDYIKRIEKLSQDRKGLETYTPSVPNDPELIDKKT